MLVAYSFALAIRPIRRASCSVARSERRLRPGVATGRCIRGAAYLFDCRIMDMRYYQGNPQNGHTAVSADALCSGQKKATSEIDRTLLQTAGGSRSCATIHGGLALSFGENADSPLDGNRPSSAQHSLWRGDCACLDKSSRFPHKISTLGLERQRHVSSTHAGAMLSTPIVDVRYSTKLTTRRQKRRWHERERLPSRDPLARRSCGAAHGDSF